MTSLTAEQGRFFEEGFSALTGYPAFGWQRRLYSQHFVSGDVPATVDIPTGLGKTSVVVIWLLALAWRAGSPALRK